MMGQDIDDLQAILLASLRRNGVTENDLFLPIVEYRIEVEFPDAAHVENGPPRQGARNCNNIVLRVASVDSESVQFQELSAVVFIQSGSANSHRQRQIVAHNLRLKIIQVQQHCGMPRRGQQHVLEVSEDVGPNGVALEAGQQNTIPLLAV